MPTQRAKRGIIHKALAQMYITIKLIHLINLEVQLILVPISITKYNSFSWVFIKAKIIPLLIKVIPGQTIVKVYMITTKGIIPSEKVQELKHSN